MRFKKNFEKNFYVGVGDKMYFKRESLHIFMYPFLRSQN